MQKYGKGAKYLIFSDVRLILRSAFALPSFCLRSAFERLLVALVE